MGAAREDFTQSHQGEQGSECGGGVVETYRAADAARLELDPGQCLDGAQVGAGDVPDLDNDHPLVTRL